MYLYLPGEGIRLEKCRELAESLGVLGQVGFPGAQRSVLPALYASDIAVSAELRGTLSMPLLSAMACGLPVVAADTKGNRQIVRDGANGYLYPAIFPPSFRRSLRRFYFEKSKKALRNNRRAFVWFYRGISRISSCPFFR